ncbi:MAG: hypothetical protein ACRDT6_23585 [Micromonosporaceae bacterium]
MNKTIVKSIGAVLAGLVIIVALSNGTDTILEATGVFPSIEEQQKHGLTTGWMVTLAFAYRILFMVVGGYFTAALAPNRPTRHAIILGIIGIIMGTIGAAVAWNITPAWFSIGLVVLGLPCVWLGGKLRIKIAKVNVTG